MKLAHTENELSPEVITLLGDLTGSTKVGTSREDDFGIDDSWLESFIEDTLGG